MCSLARLLRCPCQLHTLVVLTIDTDLNVAYLDVSSWLKSRDLRVGLGFWREPWWYPTEPRGDLGRNPVSLLLVMMLREVRQNLGCKLLIELIISSLFLVSFRIFQRSRPPPLDHSLGDNPDLASTLRGLAHLTRLDARLVRPVCRKP